MKRRWRLLPSVIRWLLVTVILLTMVAGGAYAYTALTATVEVTVIECLTWVGDSSFTVQMYPQEEVAQQFTLANASSLDMQVDILSTVTPDPGSDITVTVPKSVTIPASGQQTFDITVSASKQAPPVAFTVSLSVDR